MTTLEYRASPYREVFGALVAAVIATCARSDAVTKAAHRAAATVRPQALFEIRPRRFLIWEHGEQLVRADGDFIVHGCSLCFADNGRAQDTSNSASLWNRISERGLQNG